MRWVRLSSEGRSDFFDTPLKISFSRSCMSLYISNAGKMKECGKILLLKSSYLNIEFGKQRRFATVE